MKESKYPSTQKGSDRGVDRKRKSPLDLSTMVYGKVPPQAKDLEEAILGAIMLESTVFDEVAELIKPECFYVEAHQRIFRAMQRLANKSNPIDILTVAEELRKTEELEVVGGPYYVTKLTNAVVSAANIRFHCEIVLNKYIQREVIRIGGMMIGEAYEDSTDAMELLEMVEENVLSINNNLHRSGYQTMDSLLVKNIQDIESMRNSKQEITGIPSGYSCIDKVTHGWQNTDLIILAARPAVGKTAFALKLARNAAMNPLKPTPVALFSLEMGAKQLTQRMISSESGIAFEKIKKGRLEEDDMKQIYGKAIQSLSQVPIIIDDTPALNIFELRAKCRRLKKKYGIGLIIIDYLQLMMGTGNERNREQEVATISRHLKAIAKELDVPLIALSQLSRNVENRTGEKMPQLADLRDSGAIEQDADSVIFMYRPDYYGIQKNAMGESTTGETHFKFAKHRNGPLETIRLRAQLWIQNFVEMEDFSDMIGTSSDPRLSGPVNVGSQLSKAFSNKTKNKANHSIEDGNTDNPEALPF